MFYKSTFYKSMFYKSTPVHSTPLHIMFYIMPKLNAWKKLKNSRHVTGSLGHEIYLLSDLYDKLALCSLKLYKFDFGNDEEIVFQVGDILSGSDRSKGNVEESDLRRNLKADVLAVQGQIDNILTKRMKLLPCKVSSLKRKLKGNKG